MESNENKAKALKMLKEHMENYVNQYSATQPGLVKGIQYFIDWLKTADESCISAIEKNVYMRHVDIEARLEGFKTSGDVRYTRSFNTTYAGYIVSDISISNNIVDCYYSINARTKVIPNELNAVCEGEGKRAFDRTYPDFVFDKATLIRYEISDPTTEKFLECTCTYPFKEKTRTFHFVIIFDKLFTQEEPKRTGGCYIATCVYGSYEAPEVVTLRRYRDDVLKKSFFGRTFIKTYYSISPLLVRQFGQTKWFKNIFKKFLDKKVNRLNKDGIPNTPYDND